jgi:DNA-binding transcriptional MerR regulator
MIARDPSGLYDTREAATLAGVTARTIRSWREKGYLARTGIGDRNQALFSAAAVRHAEGLARDKGIATTGIDPRLLRKPPPPPAGIAALSREGRTLMADDPADWEAILPDGTSQLIPAVTSVYCDERYFPGCVVLRGNGGGIAGIVPVRNLWLLHRVTAREPRPEPEAEATARPSPASLAALQARGVKPGST